MNESEVTHEDVADLLVSLGWSAKCDAQWHHLRDAIPQLRTMLAAAPTPPAQEDEPIYQWWDGECWMDVRKEQCELAEARGAKYIRKVYLHPADDKLRKAAEEAEAVLSAFCGDERWNGSEEKMILDNLRAALEATPSNTGKQSPG